MDICVCVWGGGVANKHQKRKQLYQKKLRKFLEICHHPPKPHGGRKKAKGDQSYVRSQPVCTFTGEVSQFTCEFLCYLNHPEGLKVEDTLPNSLSGAAEH